MPILLDTSVAICLLEGSRTITEGRRAERDSPLLSVVSRVELIPGLYNDGSFNRVRAERLSAFLEEVEELPFATPEAEAYQHIIAVLGFSRRLIVDRMIAATALANDLTLATLNPRDFRGIDGLTIEDWSR